MANNEIGHRDSEGKMHYVSPLFELTSAYKTTAQNLSRQHPGDTVYLRLNGTLYTIVNGAMEPMAEGAPDPFEK